MSESGDFDPGPWRGHDFHSAYRRYDSHVGRSYDDAVSKNTAKTDLVEPSIATDCVNPLIILTDVTGSMGEWPKWMFSKLPYLELEAKEYLGDDLEIAFGAIGDAYCDSYPLQIRPFTSGTDLKTRMEELIVEGGGGGQIQETYEIGGCYCVHNVLMPNAIRPILIIIGDEKPYPFVTPEMAKEVAGVTLEKRLETKTVFEQLKERFSVYLIRKPYHTGDGDGMSATDKEIRRQWAELLGEDHICDLPDAQRVVDVIFGILAQETGRIEYFREEIEERQKDDPDAKRKVGTVYKSLASIHQLPHKRPKGGSSPSILKIEDKRSRKASRRLL